jgi:hypothetical protein
MSATEIRTELETLGGHMATLESQLRSYETDLRQEDELVRLQAQGHIAPTATKLREAKLKALQLSKDLANARETNKQQLREAFTAAVSAELKAAIRDVVHARASMVKIQTRQAELHWATGEVFEPLFFGELLGVSFENWIHSLRARGYGALVDKELS